MTPPSRSIVRQLLRSGFVAVILLCAVTVVGSGTVFAEEHGDGSIALAGNGTAENPYEVTTIEEYRAIGNDLDAHYVLESDIDGSQLDGSGENDYFPVIGDLGDNETFYGTIDGQNHTIKTPESSKLRYLIPVNNGTISDLRIERGLIREVFLPHRYPAAGLVGENNGTISGVTVVGPNFRTDHTGGIAGTNRGRIVESKLVNATLTADAGGIAITNRNGTIVDSEVVGVTLEHSGDVGGIAAHTRNGTIENVSVAGAVRGTTVGGVAGYANETSIRDATVSGRVEGETAGGIAGRTTGSQIARVRMTARVKGDRPGHVIGDTAGGLVGVVNETAVTEAVVGGLVTGTTTDVVAGVTDTESRERLAAVYYDRNRTGQTSAADSGNGSVIGLSTAEMIGPDAEIEMPELDFEERWVPTDGYPALRTDGDGEFRETVRVRSAELADRVVVRGNTTQVTLTVENLRSGQTVYRPGITAGTRSLDVGTVALSPGEQRSLAVTWNATETGPVPIRVDGTQYKTLAVVTEPTPALIEIDAPDRVAAGERFAVTAALENAADVAINATVDYESATRTESRELSVGPGGANVEFALVENETGTVTHTISVRNESQTVSTEIREPPSVNVSSVEAPESVSMGEEFTVEVTLANEGGIETTVPVTLASGNGETFDQREVSLSPGETTVELTHSIDDEGATELRVETPENQQTEEISVEADGESQDSTDSSDDNGPGFGVGAAAVALVGLVVAGRYRD